MNRFKFNGTGVAICHVPLLDINFLIGHFNVSILIRNLDPFPRIADCLVKLPAL
jgi:hypothetical protein